MAAVTFDQALDFTRGSEGTYVGADGLVKTAAVDEPRFTHDPESGKARGLLIEEQRTRLNTLAAAPTAPENVTVTAVAHTISFYGTGTVDLSGAATGTLVGTAEGERVTLTFTPAAGTLTLTPSGTVTDLQLEAGGFATSVIRGEGTQVTRAADNCSRTLGAEFNPDEGTIFVDYVPEQGDATYGRGGSLIFRLYNSKSGFTNQVAAGRHLGNLNITFRDIDGSGFDIPSASYAVEPIVLGQRNKIAVAWKKGVGLFMACNGVYGEGLNGNQSGFEAEGLTLTTAYDGSRFLGTKRDVRYSPRALSEAELTALTALEA